MKQNATFCDVFGLDADLLGMVPRPVIAVVLLFPIEQEERAEQAKAPPASEASREGLFYIKQKIGNACGTIALLHAIANNAGADAAAAPLQLEEGSFLGKLCEHCRAMSPDERADYLDAKAEAGLESAHNSAAVDDVRKGETITEEDMSTNLHFVCYVEKNGKLWELDGRNPAGPSAVADCDRAEVLEKAASAIQKRMSASSSLQFSVMACNA